MQGGEAFVHKVLEWEGGPKFVNSVRGRIEVQVCMEGGMGGAKVSRDDLEASNQRQSEFVGENVVSARWLVGPGGEAGRHQVLTAPSGGNGSKVGPPLRREHVHHLLNVLGLGIEINGDESRARAAQEVVLKNGAYNAAGFGRLGFRRVPPECP